MCHHAMHKIKYRINVFPCCRDEELLARGLELNDSLQSLLARHDAIAAGSPLPLPPTSSSPQRTETSSSSLKQSEVRDSSPRDASPRPNVIPSAPVTTMTRSQIYEEEEEEDEFAQLARRFVTLNPVCKSYFVIPFQVPVSVAQEHFLLSPKHLSLTKLPLPTSPLS